MSISDPIFYFIFIKIISEYKKVEEKYSHVANYLSHKRTKNHVEILSILGYTQMANIYI
jgi:hypothetical protein